MRKKTIMAGLGVLGALAVALAAHAQGDGARSETRRQPPMQGQGPGLEGRIVQWVAGNPEAVKELGLSTQQVTQLRADLTSTRKQLIDLKAKMEKHALDQAELMREDNPDEAALMKAVEETGRIRTEIAKLEMQQFLTLRKVLTADQRTKLRETMKERFSERWQERRGGPGPAGGTPEGRARTGRQRPEGPPPKELGAGHEGPPPEDNPDQD